MKNVFLKYSIFAVLAIAAAFMSCKQDDDDDEIVNYDEYNIILTMDHVTEVKFNMTGETTCMIDWGDGSEIEEFTFSSLNDDRFQHHYLMELNYTIAITGDDIMSLTFGGSSFTSLDVSNNPALISLIFNDTQITNLDVSKNTSLVILDCKNNHHLAELDLSNNVALQELWCEYNRQFTQLDVSNNVELTILNCFDNELAELNVSNNTALQYLNCSFNLLTQLDVSKNVDLNQLRCHTNQLTELDVSNNVQLTFLVCGNNLLTQLDMSNNIALENLDCSYNHLEAAALLALFESLPSNNQHKYINIFNNPGTLICKKTIAEDKGWWIYDGTGPIASVRKYQELYN